MMARIQRRSSAVGRLVEWRQWKEWRLRRSGESSRSSLYSTPSGTPRNESEPPPGVLGNQSASELSIEWKKFNFRYRSPFHYVDFFRTYYGLCRKAYEKVGPEGEDALTNDILALVEEFNIATDGSVTMPSDYAQVVMTKAPH